MYSIVVAQGKRLLKGNASGNVSALSAMGDIVQRLVILDGKLFTIPVDKCVRKLPIFLVECLPPSI